MLPSHFLLRVLRLVAPRVRCVLLPAHIKSYSFASNGFPMLPRLHRPSFHERGLHSTSTPNDLKLHEKSTFELLDVARTWSKSRDRSRQSAARDLVSFLIERQENDATHLAEANLLMGHLLSDGVGGGVNLDEAVQCFLRAANLGHADGHYCLGVLAMQGKKRTLERVQQSINHRQSALLSSSTSSTSASMGVNPLLSGVKQLVEPDLGVQELVDEAGRKKVRYQPASSSPSSVHVDAMEQQKEVITSLRAQLRRNKQQKEQHRMSKALSRGIPPQGSSALSQYTLADEPRNEEAAIWFTTASQAGHLGAKVALANILLSTDGPLANESEAIELYQEAASKNHPDACFNLGQIYFNGTLAAPQDVNKALGYFQKAADMEDKAALYFLGHCYWSGEWLPRDPQKALQYLSKASAQGHPMAEYYISLIFRSFAEGEFPVDVMQMTQEQCQAEFRRHLTKAVELGSPEAAFALADLYYHGAPDLPRDSGKALEFYLLAGVRGHGEGLCCAGAMFFNGDGVEQSYLKALAMYSKAAELGSYEAFKNMASMYHHGHGVERDEKTADLYIKLYEEHSTADSDAERR
eukprot:GILJ01011141.1.p1 GENE.GILJ01011141.1~~GILJ01011141.1.p1  ORF type:complete len:580 (-),score=66.51 GILJ01011141.1:177-1916(-)